MRQTSIGLVLTSITILLAALGAAWGTGNAAQGATGTFLDANDNLKISTSRPRTVNPGNPMTPAALDEHFKVSPDPDLKGPDSDFSGRPQRAATSTVVTFPDANLEAAIREALNKPSGDITSEDMKTLTSLNASGRGILDLTGIEHATNLTVLELHNNQISDISALTSLTNLTTLWLSNNQISDISTLSSLTNLTQLLVDNLYLSPLGNNQISDISALSSLTNLTTLDLFDNQISDISALGFLTNLTTLRLGFNQISDISALTSLTNLTQLRLFFNEINDISALTSLTNLNRLYLNDNHQISDILALDSLTNLTTLWLSNNQISDISALGSLTDLTQLWLFGNRISDISVLGSLTNLTRLRLDLNLISDISPLVANEGISDGDFVDLRNNPLSQESNSVFIPQLQARGVDVRFTPFPITFPDANLEAAIREALNKPTGTTTSDDLKNMTSLSASQRGIQDLTGIEYATNLTTLYLQNNQITDISALNSLTNLTSLWLYSNQISDISALNSLTNLTSLWLHNNQITDISALVANAGLSSGDFVDLRSNPLSQESHRTFIPQLEARGVVVQFTLYSITFPDANLEAAIRTAVNRPTGTITSDDMKNLTNLPASERGIQDLTGMGYANQLTDLRLDGNQISDISALVANVGLSDGDFVDIQNNPLSQQSYDTFIPQLQARGVDVRFTPSPTAIPALTPWALIGVTALLALLLTRRTIPRVTSANRHEAGLRRRGRDIRG